MEVVYWDLETTGLDAVNKHVDIEILEIGAISETGGEKFAQYILPTAPIPRDASKVHNIYLKKVPGRRGQRLGYDMTKLYFKEDGRLVQVDAVDKKTGLKMFLDWLKGFDKKIVLAGYNNHNFDDWVLAHNLLQVDLDVSGLGVQFGDVAKVVRPILNREFHTKKWKLGFAVSCLLQRDQNLAHGALSDAEDARDLLIKLGEKQQSSTQDILEETLGHSDERLRALKDFDEVMKVCVKMFLSSGAGMARSVTREDRVKEKWKKHAEKKKIVQEQQILTRKGKDTKSPKKLNPSNGVETRKKYPKPLKNAEEEIRIEQHKSNLQRKDVESQVLEIRNGNLNQLSEKSNLTSFHDEGKIHKGGLIMASDLPKRLPSNSSNKLAATLGQTKYQQTKLNFKTAPKAITTQASFTKITATSIKTTGSSAKPTRESLTEITMSSINKSTVALSTSTTGAPFTKSTAKQNWKLNENNSRNAPSSPSKRHQLEPKCDPKIPAKQQLEPKCDPKISAKQQVETKCDPKIPTQQLVERKCDPKIPANQQVEPKCDPKISVPSSMQPQFLDQHNLQLEGQAIGNKLNIPDLECSIPFDEWDQSVQWDQCSIPLDEWDQSFKCDQSFQDGHNKGEISIQQAKNNSESSNIITCESSNHITVDISKQGMEDLNKENEIMKHKENSEPFVVEKKLLKIAANDQQENISNIEENVKVELLFKDKKVKCDDTPSDSVVSKLASHFNNISVCDHKNELSDLFNDFSSECDENDDIFDSDLSDIIDEITGKKTL